LFNRNKKKTLEETGRKVENDKPQNIFSELKEKRKNPTATAAAVGCGCKIRSDSLQWNRKIKTDKMPNYKSHNTIIRLAR